MNLAWLQRQRKLFNSAALGCCFNYAQVLSKQNESMIQARMRVYPQMKFEFLFSLFIFVGDEFFPWKSRLVNHLSLAKLERFDFFPIMGNRF